MSDSIDDEGEHTAKPPRKPKPLERVMISLRVDAELANELDKHLVHYNGSRNDFICHLIKTAVVHGAHLRKHGVIDDSAAANRPPKHDDNLLSSED